MARTVEKIACMSQIDYVWGIDPGSRGGVAIISRDRTDIEIITISKYTESELAGLFFTRGINRGHVFIEQVNPRPGEGVKSVFTFGRAYGFLRGLVLANRMPLEEVSPQTWQQKLALGKKYPSKAIRKRVHMAKGQQLFPQVKTTLENADALLIAEYGWRALFRN